MITDEEIRKLITEEENAANACRSEAIKEKDCLYEIGTFLHNANVSFLVDALDGKVKLTKTNVKKLLNDCQYYLDILDGKKPASIVMDGQVTMQSRWIAVGRADLLKSILDRFYSEIKHRVSRKQLIASARKNVDEARNNLNAYKHEMLPFYSICGEMMSCQHMDGKNGDFTGTWCIKNVLECRKSGCVHYKMYQIKDNKTYIDLVSDLELKVSELEDLERKNDEKI